MKPLALTSAQKALTYRGVGFTWSRAWSSCSPNLVQNQGRLVPREELLERLWPEGAGTDDALSYAASSLRRALGGCRGRPIAIVRGRGYRFDSALSEVLQRPRARRLIDRAAELRELRKIASAVMAAKLTRLAVVKAVKRRKRYLFSDVADTNAGLSSAGPTGRTHCRSRSLEPPALL